MRGLAASSTRARAVVLIAAGVIAVAAAAGPVGGQGHSRESSPPAPSARQQITDACRAFAQIVEFGRAGLVSPPTLASAAWRDAEHRIFQFRRHTPNLREAPAELREIWNCHCPILKVRLKVEQWWRLREMDQLPVLGTDEPSHRNRQAALESNRQSLQAELRLTEQCYRKACGAFDDAPCPPPTLAVKSSAPIQRPAPLGDPTPAALHGELEALRQDLDRFWKAQFASHGRPLYSSPGGLALCTQGSCYYAPRTSRDPQARILYNAADLREAVKQYGRASLVFSMAHEFGHHTQANSLIPYVDPDSELLADRLAGAYVASLHRQGIVLGDRAFGPTGAGAPRRPCPDDDLRWLKSYIDSIADVSVPSWARGALHALGAPPMHGSGAERWHAFSEGYTKGIPPDVFRLHTKTSR